MPAAPDGGAQRTIAIDGVSKAFGGVPVLVDVDLVVPSGQVVALLGPSGCGKTTLLRIIAGLDRPDAGVVRIGDRVLSGPGAFIAPEKRQVGMVFQDWALFPHLSVARNVAYGLPRSPERDQRVADALARVGLAGLGDRMPGTLSGGQQQRVALARVIAPEPRVLLLDEPFSNLDTSLRHAVRSEVAQLLAELAITTVLVTHDQEEAFVLGDQVAVMQGGRIVQHDSPAALYRRPATPWVAGFVGDANLVLGQLVEDASAATTRLGTVPLAAPPVPVGPDGLAVRSDGLAGSGGEPDDALDVLIRPEDLEVFEAVVDDNAARIELVEFYGHDTVYVVRLADGSTVRARESAAPQFDRHDSVSIRYAGGPSVAFARRAG